MIDVRVTERPFKLSHVVWNKRYFNPYSKEDVKEYKHFLDENSWNTGCQFYLEWPYLTITEMIRSKLINAHIESMISNGE